MEDYTNGFSIYNPLRVSGAVSGLDTESIIDAILESETRRLNELQKEQETLELKQEVYQEVKSKLEEFMDFLFNYKLSSTFRRMKIDVSNEDALSVSVTTLKQPTSFKVRVLNLATYSTYNPSENFGEIPDSSTQYSSLNTRVTPVEGTFYINGVEIEVESTDTISDIVDKINSSSAGVTAVYDDTTGKLELTSSSEIRILNGTSNFIEVFNLSDAPLVYSGGTYSLESTVHVGAERESSSISSVGSKKGYTFNAGSIKINGVSIELDGTETLSDFIRKVNSSDANVYAWYSYSEDKVYIRSKVGGSTDIILEDTDSTNVFKILGLDGGTVSAGNSAHIQVSFDGANWTDYYSNSNTIEMDGLNITVKSTTPTDVEVSVSRDIDSVIDVIGDFVEKFNEITEYLYNKLNEEPVEDKDWDEMTEDEKKQGILRNDPTLRRIFDEIRSIIYTTVQGLDEYRSLPEIGITTGSIGSGYENMMKGKIELDEDELRSALEDNFDDVVKLFTLDEDESEGIAVQLYSKLREYTKFGGLIDSIAGVNGSISREMSFLSEMIVEEATRLQERELMLWRQFAILENFLSRIQIQSGWLSQTFGQTGNTTQTG